MAIKYVQNDWEKSPYSGAKYAHLLGFSEQPNCIERSRRLINDQILPQSRKKNESLAYVLKEAAILAIKDRDFVAARIYLSEAELICNKLGVIHTKKQILKIRGTISD